MFPLKNLYNSRKTSDVVQFFQNCRRISESNIVAYPELRQTSQMELLAKVVNGFQPLTVFARNSVLDVWEGSEYASILKWRGTWVQNKIRANAIQILIVCYFTGNTFQKSLKFFCIIFIEIEIWLLTHFSPKSHFYTPWKRQNFWRFQGVFVIF